MRTALRTTGRSPLKRNERRNMCAFFFGSSEESCDFPREYHLLAHLMANTQPSTDGMWLEFGVFNGTSLNMTADAKRRLCQQEGTYKYDHETLVHGFDSFEGLPTTWKIKRTSHNINKRQSKCGCKWTAGGGKCGHGDGSRCWVACCGGAATTGSGTIRDAPVSELTVPAGTFSLGGVMPPVRPNAALVKGLFSETLPPFLTSRGPVERVRFASLDMDLYDGALTVLRELTPLLVGGGRAHGGTLLHFHEIVHATDDGILVPVTSTHERVHESLPSRVETMMDEALALYDWMHGMGEPTTRQTACVALELVPRQVHLRDEAAAFFVLRV